MRGGDGEYRGEATSLEGFVQQLAANYLPHGYWHYVTGWIPERKDPRAVDRKLIAKYRITASRGSRFRRKQAGLANLHYLRHRRFFVLLATAGAHPFLAEEKARLKDVRVTPIIYGGYSLTVTRGQFLKKQSVDEPAAIDGKHRVRVQIARLQYAELKAYFLEAGWRRPLGQVAAELYGLPFEPYAPVRKQLLNLLRLVNEKRQEVRLEKLGPEVLRYRRRIVPPFEREPCGEQDADRASGEAAMLVNLREAA